MMRSTVRDAPVVCRVENTKWPVSAAVMAASIVSRSRISPTRITSGSWRSTRLSASPKVGTSTPTSRWLTMPWRCWWKYSMGSSTVTTCRRERRLITSIMEASDVDFPEPVGPVTRINPRGMWINSCMIAGRPISSIVRMRLGISRATMPTEPFCKNRLTRKRASSRKGSAKSTPPCS